MMKMVDLQFHVGLHPLNFVMPSTEAQARGSAIRPQLNVAVMPVPTEPYDECARCIHRSVQCPVQRTLYTCVFNFKLLGSASLARLTCRLLAAAMHGASAADLTTMAVTWFVAKL